MRTTSLAILAICGVLGLTGCKTVAEKREEVERDKRMHERLDDIQGQLLSIQERQQPETSSQAEPVMLRPVVPTREGATPVEMTDKDRLNSLTVRHNVKPVERKTAATKRGGSTGGSSSLRANHIRVPVPVSVIQKQLIAAGFSPGPVDGKVGPKTVEAIKAFQRKEGLKEDGVIGPVTWARLRNVGGG